MLENFASQISGMAVGSLLIGLGIGFLVSILISSFIRENYAKKLEKNSWVDCAVGDTHCSTCTKCPR